MKFEMSGNRLKFLIPLLLSLVTAAVYARAAYAPFNILDDYEYLVHNRQVLSGWSAHSLRWAFTALHSSNWHPLTWLSLMLDARFFGTDPMGYHLVNVALHVANSALLFRLFLYLTGATWRSALVAALFALHPMHVESVVWIAERKDVLSTLFWFLTLLCYAAYVKKSRKDWYLLSLAAFALGLMAKPMLVTVPVVLLLLDFWPLGRCAASAPAPGAAVPAPGPAAMGGVRRIWFLLIEKIPFLLLSAASSLLTLQAQKPGLVSITQLPFGVRVSNALWSLTAYLGKLFFPVQLAVYYPLAPVAPWKVACAVLLLCGILYLVFRRRFAQPYLAFGFLWYLVTLMPVIGVIQVGLQSMADRYSYVPYLGLFVMAVWWGGDLAERYPHRLKLAVWVAGALVAACAVLTWLQVGYWQDNVTLYAHTLEITEDNWVAHSSLGQAYFDKGQAELAVKQYQQALEINPNDSATHCNLGLVLYQKMGRPAEAIRQFEAAIAINPRVALTHYNMANALVNLGEIRGAVAEYRKAVELDPENPYAVNDLGMTLVQLGEYDEAIRQLTEALRLQPDFPQAANNLQFAREQQAHQIR
jgi:protein O-mannosyl-transferase